MPFMLPKHNIYNADKADTLVLENTIKVTLRKGKTFFTAVQRPYKYLSSLSIQETPKN